MKTYPTASPPLCTALLDLPSPRLPFVPGCCDASRSLPAGGLYVLCSLLTTGVIPMQSYHEPVDSCDTQAGRSPRHSYVFYINPVLD
jgi:hypothetical protein